MSWQNIHPEAISFFYTLLIITSPTRSISLLSSSLIFDPQNIHHQEMSYQDYPPPAPGYGSSTYPPPAQLQQLGYSSVPPPPPGYPSAPPQYNNMGYHYPPPSPSGGYSYQGYFAPGPPQPQPPYHCHHDSYDDHDDGSSFLKGCLTALCFCCVLEECCGWA